MRKLLAALLFAAVSAPVLSHYYFLRPIANPTSTTSTTTGTPSAPTVTTQWRCITAAGATISGGGPFATKLAAETPCGVAVAAAGPSATPTHFLEESVITVTNVPTTTTVRTRRDEVLGGNTVRVADAHAAVLLAAHPGGQTTPPVGDCAEPYARYTALCLTDIPFQGTPGAWGSGATVVAPTLPTTNRTVTVDTAAEFNAEADTAGTHIIIDGNLISGGMLNFRADDIDVEVLPGSVTADFLVGWTSPAESYHRIRVRGTTPGTHSGGLIGTFVCAAVCNDITIDGVDMNGQGSGGNSAVGVLEQGGSDRMAIVNVRAHVAAWFTQTTASSLVIANTNVYHGARTRAQVGAPEGWGIRSNANAAGPVVIVDSRIEGTRYHNIRVHSSSGSTDLAYIANNVLVSLYEGRVLWGYADISAGQEAEGIWAINNAIYSYIATSSCFGSSFEQDGNSVTDYGRYNGNAFYSTTAGGAVNFSAGYMSSREASYTGAGDDWNTTTGNTFAALQARPAWGDPGDPTEIALPSGAAPTLGEGNCTGPP